MSLNYIQLDSSLLANMYGSLLVEFKEEHQVGTESAPISRVPGLEQKAPVPTEWRFLGQNKKSILFIVRYGDATYLPDEQLNFLTTVVAACKLSLADIAILNLSNAPSAVYKEVQEKFKPSYTILFGITPAEFEMPVSFPEFQVQALNNCTFLHTPRLERVESDKVLKSKFWVCLRKMFDV